MEVDITEWFEHEATDLWCYSGSIATHGKDAGKNTWAAAQDRAKGPPVLLKEPKEIEACRDHLKSMGFSFDGKPSAYTDDMIRALFIQLIAGDVRELGEDEAQPFGVDWKQAEADDRMGSLYPGDDGRLYYYLGD